MPRVSSNCSTRAVLTVLVFMGAMGAGPAQAAEFGTGPWVKGYTDIFGGIVPPQPGLYVRNDAYHYEGDAGATVLNGKVQISVDEQYMADILALTYVTPWKILGGTYAVAVAPSIVQMNVGVGATLAPITLPGPLGLTVGPFSVSAIDSELALGDTAFAPLVLGWNAGNFHWNFALFGYAPTGEYSTRQLANTSLHHWAVMPRLAATYFNPKTGWQVNGAAIYSVNFENPATDYETGNILNLDGAITKNFGALGLGAVAYAMIQTTPDSGAGARLGSFESRVYAAGPIVTYTLGAGTPTPLTLLAKWYHEFDAENTFEGNVVDVAASFKF
ncbi:MAG: transporter [Methyloceanibacter sp.]